MWGIETHEIKAMAKARCNATYLPDVDFPPGLEVTTEFEEAAAGASDLLIVVPSPAFREMLERCRSLPTQPEYVAWATKGFEAETGLLPHQVADEVLESRATTAVLSGPTFAAEVGLGLPSAITIASRDPDYALRLAQSIATDNFRAYTSTDVIGVEVGGAANRRAASRRQIIGAAYRIARSPTTAERHSCQTEKSTNSEV